MVIDLLEKSRVNIKDLTISELKKGTTAPLFDPEKEISDRDWIGMTYGFNFNVESGWKHSLRHYFYLKYTTPERFSKLAIREQQWKWTKEVVESSSAEDAITNFALATAFFPGKRDELSLNSLTDKLMKAYLSGLRDDQKWEDFHQGAFYHSITFPDSIPSLCLDEQSWQGIYALYRRNLEEAARFPYRLVKAADMLALMKVNYPQRISEVKIQPSFFPRLREILESTRRTGNWNDNLGFSNIAFDLTILGAEEIRFTEQGMEIVGQSKPESVLSENAPDLPQRRRF